MSAQAQATNIADLRKKSNLPANQVGGATVAQFFEANSGSIAAVLPKTMSPERLMKVALGAIRTTPALLECTTKSLFGAVVQCAQMGLEPNTVLGHAYLVPFNAKDKRTGQYKKDVQVIIGYKGLIDLARRSGQINSIVAHGVFERDEFVLEQGLEDKLIHKPYLLGDRGQVVGFYAVAKIKDSDPVFEFMSVADVRKVMASTQSKGAYGPWKDHFVEMGRKTVIRRITKYLPLSVEFATAVAIDDAADSTKPQNMAAVLDGDYSVLPGDAAYAEYQEQGDGDGDGDGDGGGQEQAPPTAAQEKRSAAQERPAKQRGPTIAEAVDMANRGMAAEALDIARSIGGNALEQVQSIIDEIDSRRPPLQQAAGDDDVDMFGGAEVE